MRRRDFVGLCGVVAATAPVIVRAQPKARPVIGVLGSGFPEDPAVALNLTMLRRGLRQEGFVEGQNVDIEYRWARNQPERLPALAAELVARPVDVIVNEGGSITAVQAKKATSTIPIVFHASNAIADGLVDNFARPGGNLTGVSQFGTETLAKATQFLAELVPSAKTIAFLSIPSNPVAEKVMREALEAQGGMRRELRVLTAETDAEIEAAYATLARLGAPVIVSANVTYAERLVKLAARYRVPAVYNQRAYVEAGGLLSYGASIPAAYVIKGLYTGKLLKGARVRDLPVQQPSKFELALNLKTAETLGLGVPQSILLAADEVIE